MEISENLSIPENEKENIDLLASIIYGLSGEDTYLEVVGGAVDKNWPRKDIDMVIGMSFEGEGDELSKASESLQKLEALVHQVSSASGGYFRKGKVQKPYPDPQFNSNDILDHAGSIEIIPKSGTKIELIQVDKNNI